MSAVIGFDGAIAQLLDHAIKKMAANMEERLPEIIRAELQARDLDRRISGWKSIGEALGKSAEGARKFYERDQRTGATGFAALVFPVGDSPTVKKSDLDAWIARGGK